MSRDAPSWLAQLQARFGAVIRTPLDRSSGTLTATPSSYDEQLLSDTLDGPNATGAERLAVYNRQYWFRLFDVFQIAFPLTARLLGYWTFNDYAARFLLAHPPTHWDLERATHGFEAFFVAAIDETASVPRQALIEGARIDASWQRVFRAPAAASYRPSAADAARLLDARLTPSPAVAIVEEHWPLLELRRDLGDNHAEAPIELPPALASPRRFALVRRQEGIGQLPLEAREAQLFTLLVTSTVRDALAQVEAACPQEEREELPAKARAWLARSVELDFWIGIG